MENGKSKIWHWFVLLFFAASFLYASGEDAKSKERAYCHGTCEDKQ